MQPPRPAENTEEMNVPSKQAHAEKMAKYIGLFQLLAWFQALYTKFILSGPLSGLVKLHTIGRLASRAAQARTQSVTRFRESKRLAS